MTKKTIKDIRKGKAWLITNNSWHEVFLKIAITSDTADWDNH